MQTATWMAQTCLSGLSAFVYWVSVFAGKCKHSLMRKRWTLSDTCPGMRSASHGKVFIILLMFAKTQYLWLAMGCYWMATHVTNVSHKLHLYCTLCLDNWPWMAFPLPFFTLSILPPKFQLTFNSFLLRLLILKWHFNLDWLPGQNW